MDNLLKKTIVVKNFNIEDGYQMPHYTERVLQVEEITLTYWRYVLKFDYDTKTKRLNIFSNGDIAVNDIEVTFFL